MPKINIKGRVIHPNGEPAKNVQVKVFDLDHVNGQPKDQEIFSGVTDDDGNFAGQSKDWQKKIKTKRQLMPWEPGFPGEVTESNYDLSDILVMKARVSKGSKTQDIFPFISHAPAPIVVPWSDPASVRSSAGDRGRRSERGDSGSAVDLGEFVEGIMMRAEDVTFAVVDGISQIFSGKPIARVGDTDIYANDPEKLFRELKMRMESGHAKVTFDVFGPAATMFAPLVDLSREELVDMVKTNLNIPSDSVLFKPNPIEWGVVVIVCMALICMLIFPLTAAAGFLFICIGIGLLVALALGYKCLELSTCPEVSGDVLDDSGGVEFENCVTFTLAMDASACGD